jgi:hypothetical protein
MLENDVSGCGKIDREGHRIIMLGRISPRYVPTLANAALRVSGARIDAVAIPTSRGITGDGTGRVIDIWPSVVKVRCRLPARVVVWLTVLVEGNRAGIVPYARLSNISSETRRKNSAAENKTAWIRIRLVGRECWSISMNILVQESCEACADRILTASVIAQIDSDIAGVIRTLNSERVSVSGQRRARYAAVRS